MEKIDEALQKLSELDKKIEAQNILKKPILNFVEGCNYLDLSESYVYKLTSTKQIPHFRPLGKKIYFKREDLDEWLLRNRQSSVDEIEQSANNFKLKDSSIKNIL